MTSSRIDAEHAAGDFEEDLFEFPERDAGIEDLSKKMELAAQVVDVLKTPRAPFNSKKGQKLAEDLLVEPENSLQTVDQLKALLSMTVSLIDRLRPEKSGSGAGEMTVWQMVTALGEILEELPSVGNVGSQQVTATATKDPSELPAFEYFSYFASPSSR